VRGGGLVLRNKAPCSSQRIVDRGERANAASTRGGVPSLISKYEAGQPAPAPRFKVRMRSRDLFSTPQKEKSEETIGLSKKGRERCCSEGRVYGGEDGGGREGLKSRFALSGVEVA